MDWRSELRWMDWTVQIKAGRKYQVLSTSCGVGGGWYDSVLNGKEGNDLFCLLRCEVVMSWSSEKNGRTTTQPGRRSEARREGEKKGVHSPFIWISDAGGA